MNSVKMIPLILLFSTLCHGGTIEVPTNYPTIQQAIDAAQPQDLILVCPGTYVENIDFLGKAITVKGIHGPGVTLIDGNQMSGVVMFQSGETQSTVLEGFTITNGKYSFFPNESGGGIACLNGSSPIIRNNIIEANTHKSLGGGITCMGSSPVISGNRIRTNDGGIGGGILCHNGSNPSIEYNRISGNEAKKGGGICCENGSSPIIHDNLIHGNKSDSEGLGGGGISCYNSSPVITNNTICGNDAGEGGGGGLFCFGDFDIDIVNTIFCKNTAYYGPEIFMDDLTSTPPNTVRFRYSSLESGLSSVWVGFGCTFVWGPNAILFGPNFVQYHEDDLHLKDISALINQGDNSAVIGPCDYDGNPRISDGTVDMGADEFHKHLYYTGDTSPGGMVNIKCIGEYGVSPVWVWVGLDLYKTPVPTSHGLWYLSPPVQGVPLGMMLFGGVKRLPAVIPPSTPVLTYFYLQALIGDELSDLLILQVN